MKNMYSITSDMREMINFRYDLIGENQIYTIDGEFGGNVLPCSRAKAALIDTIDTFIHNEMIRQFNNEKND